MIGYDNLGKEKTCIAKYARLTRTVTLPDGRKQSIAWSSRDGRPRFTACLDVDKMINPDKTVNYDVLLNARFNAENLLTIIDEFKKIIVAGEQKYCEVDCLYPKMENGKSVGTEKVVSATLRCGIDANGLCYIYIKEPGKPELKFNFEADKKSNQVWHVIRMGDVDVDPLITARKTFIKYLEILYKLVEQESMNAITVSLLDKPEQDRRNNQYRAKVVAKQEEKPVETKRNEDKDTNALLDDLGI